MNNEEKESPCCSVCGSERIGKEPAVDDARGRTVYWVEYYCKDCGHTWERRL
jgi:hypothetical protein